MKHRSFALFLLAAAFLFSAAPASAQQTPPPSCTLVSSAGVVQKGGTVNLRWQSVNAVSGSITSIGNVGPSGTQGVIPTQTTEYVGSFVGPGGSARCSVTVIVTLPGGGTTAPSGGAGQGQPQTTGAPEGGNSAFPESPSLRTGEPAIQSDTRGLVPCTGTNCQACHLASLVQNIINFLIMLAIPIAALLFAVAGAMYFSTEITNKKEQAKKIIQKGVIGFIIALSSWLVVNTVFYVLFDQDQFSGGWSRLRCVADSQRPMNSDIGSVINRALGTPQPPAGISLGTGSFGPVGGANAVGECSANYTLLNGLCYPEGGGLPEIPVYEFANPTSVSVAGLQAHSAALANACANNGLSDCAVAQAILVRESGGRVGAVSSAGAGGLMQLMPATARGLDAARLSGLSDAEVRHILTTEPQYNMHLGTKEIARLYNKYNGDVAKVAAAYNGGDKANVCGSQCQQYCGGGAAWQCAAIPNNGYAETRKYVPNVVATYKSLLNQ